MMRNLRKLIACALVAVIVLGALAACGEVPEGPADTQEDEEKTEEDASGLSSYDGQLPIIDGSISAEALADAFFGSLDNEEAAGLRASFSGTEKALERLAAGEIDAALIAADAGTAADIAEGKMGDFKLFELAKDAVVFAVSKNNMIDDLSSEQIRGIYSGEISNWKDAGGAEVQIKAYQRPEGSELRSLMESIVMVGEETSADILRPRYSGEDGLYYERSGYDTAPAAIAYAFWFQAAPGYENSKILSVDGSEPSAKNIASGEYPFGFSYYLVVNSSDLGFAGADLLAAYMQGSFVQNIIAGSGYVNLNGTPPAEDAKPSPEAAAEATESGDAEIQAPFSNNSKNSGSLTSAASAPIEWKTEYQGGRKSSPNRYVSISGLADSEAQDRINSRIEELSDEYTAGESLPVYRGLGEGSGEFGSSYEKSSSIELTFAAGDTVSFRAARTVVIDHELVIEEVRGLTFDLRTGEELSLSELFASGFDVCSVCDKAVRKYIRESMLDSADPASCENLIAPFSGISGDQSYYLSDEGLNIIIDGGNPEFDLGADGKFSPIVITVGYDLLDGSFAGSRDSDVSIYEDDEFYPYLFKAANYGLQTEVIDHYGGEDGRISVKSVYTYPQGFPKKLLSRIREDVLSYLPNTAYYEEQLADQLSGTEEISFLAVSECSSVGGYYCVRQHIMTPDADTGEVSEHFAYSLYDAELEPVTLDELFAEDAHYRDALVKKLNALIKSEITGKNMYTYNGEKGADLYEGLGFVLTPEGIDFITAPVEVGKYGKKLSETMYLTFSLEWSEFGEGAMAFAPATVEEESGEI